MSQNLVVPAVQYFFILRVPELQQLFAVDVNGRSFLSPQSVDEFVVISNLFLRSSSIHPQVHSFRAFSVSQESNQLVPYICDNVSFGVLLVFSENFIVTFPVREFLFAGVLVLRGPVLVLVFKTPSSP